MLNRKRIILIILGVIVLIGLVLIIKQFIVINPEEELSKEYTPVQEISDADLRKTIVTLYFKEGDTNKLVQEGRLIDVKLLLENPYETLIQMLILGPEASSYKKIIPEGTTLNKVELKGDVLEIDFTKDFLSTKNKEEQELVIESIKKTVTTLNEVNDIVILINGEKI